MNCTRCTARGCRNAVPCGAEEDIHHYVLDRYREPEEQNIVRAAAELVDNGRAGMLNRLEEIGEFAAAVGYKSLGVAYCFAMEEDAGLVANYLKKRGFSVSSVSCTVGGMEQSSINSASSIEAVSCNPIFQAEQLNREGVDLVITMGLCLGHDILFNKYIKADQTTLVVKDRTTGHNPLAAVRALRE